MAQSWKKVRIFISSTFRDMQAERDHLVRFVFPRLRETLLQRGVLVDDVDLRWGVTSDQNALDVCRAIIDKCRPHFLGILGGRYGWTPPGQEQSITSQEIHYAALEHPAERLYHHFYFRDPAATAAIPEPAAAIYREAPDSPAQRKLEALKQRIIDAGYQPRTYTCRWDEQTGRLVDLQPWGEQVYEDLFASIQESLGLAAPVALSEFAAEEAAIEAFVEARLDHFVPGARQSLLDRMHQHAKEPNDTLCLVGRSGSGKSAMLAHLHRELTAQAAAGPQAPAILSHFVGASPTSSNVRSMLRRLDHALAAMAGVEITLPDSYERLRDLFPELLAQAAKKRRILLLIDAIDQLEPAHDAHRLRWLPETLPPDTGLLVSLRPGPMLDTLRARGRPPTELPLPPLEKQDARAIIATFLARYGKRMDDSQTAALLAKAEADQPLYLITALEELRTLGTYEEITARIHALPGETPALFRWILQRLEDDPGFSDARGQPVGQTQVRRYFTLLAAARFGMAQAELVDLVAPGDPQGNLAALQRLVRPYLLARGPLLDFFHAQFRAAVESVYLDEDRERLEAHRHLAAYFRLQADPSGERRWRDGSARGLGELAYHLRQSLDLATLESLYSDPGYLEAVVSRVDVHPLPDGSAEYAGIAGLLAELRSTIPLVPTPQSAAHLRALLGLLAERSLLIRQAPETILQELANYGELATDPVSPTLLQEIRDPAGMLLADRSRVSPPPQGHGAAVTALAVSPTGDLFMSGAADGSVGCWQIGAAQPRWLISAHKNWVTWVAVSSSGRRGLSAGDEGVVLLWDLELGTSTPVNFPLSALPWPQACFGAFLDEQTLLTIRGSAARKIDLRNEAVLWQNSDLQPGELVEFGTGRIIDFAPQARRLVLKYGSREIRVGDGARGTHDMTLQTPGPIRHLAISADGRTLLTADYQGRLLSFALPSGERSDVVMAAGLQTLTRAFQGETFWGCDRQGNLLLIRPDGRRATVTARPLEGPWESSSLRLLACLPDNRTLVAGWDSGTITLLDVEQARVQQEWTGKRSLIRGALCAGGQGAIGLLGKRVAGGRVQGDALLHIDRAGRQAQVADSPHRHLITAVAGLGPEQTLSVDRSGVAVLWSGGNPTQAYSIETDLSACACWPEANCGVVGTLDERAIILGKDQETVPLPSTDFNFRAGITALAAAGQPPGLFAAYFNPLVVFRRQGQGWRGPKEPRHSLRGSAAALDPTCALAASGNINGEVCLWRCQDGAQLAEWALHEGEVTALAFAVDSGVLYSAGTDRLIWALDLASNRAFGATLLPIPPLALCAGPGGWLFVLDSAGSIYGFIVMAPQELRAAGRFRSWLPTRPVSGFTSE